MGNQVPLKRKELRSYLSDWFLGFGGNSVHLVMMWPQKMSVLALGVSLVPRIVMGSPFPSLTLPS